MAEVCSASIPCGPTPQATTCYADAASVHCSAEYDMVTCESYDGLGRVILIERHICMRDPVEPPDCSLCEFSIFLCPHECEWPGPMY